MSARLLRAARMAIVVLIFAAPGLLDAQSVIQRGAAVPEGVALRLWIPAGSVEVRHWTRDSVDVKATVAPGSQLIGNVSGGAGKYSVESLSPSATEFPRADIVLTVPVGATLWVKSTTAAVSVVGGRGQLDVLTVTGSVSVRNATGVVTVESIEGDVTLDSLSAVVRVRGGSGAVKVNDVTGRSVITLVRGSVEVNAGRAAESVVPAGRIETVSGSVFVRGRLGDEDQLTIVTHDGPVDVWLDPKAIPRVTAIDPPQPGAFNALVKALGAPNSGARLVIDSFKGTLNIRPIGGIR